MADQQYHGNKGEFLKCLSEFFKRDLISIPIVKKYPHTSLTQRCGLKATTLELDTAAHPNIEYIAGTRLSVYPLNPPAHVQSILEHLIDDVSSPNQTITSFSHQVSLPNWPKWVQITGKDSLRLALIYLFDIMTAPSRELLKLLSDHCQLKEHKKRLIAISQTNESWEKWLCSSHRTLKSLLEDHSSCKISAAKLINELNLQQPRQYSISNIKSSKRFRAEIIVVQHKYNLRQIELNLRQLRDRETYERAVSPLSPLSAVSTTGLSPQRSRSARSTQSRSAGGTPRLATVKSTTSGRHQIIMPAGRHSPAARPPPSSSTSSGAMAGSKGSQRSIRSTASFASSPITTHQVKRVSSFSGPLMGAYASSVSSQGGSEHSVSTQASEQSRSSKLSLLSVLQSQDQTLNSDTGQQQSPHNHQQGSTSSSSSKYEGLCSNYLLGLNASDQILCEFVENPRFTLKGNRERPIMMIGQDVGVIAFRPFWQQRHLEHDRAQVFYNMFKDLSPKKFGDMQLVCLTGHRAHIEDLFKREIHAALNGKILSSVSQINRHHLVSLLTAATTKSQLALTQPTGPKSTASSQTQSQSQSQQQPPLLINSKELLELGTRIYKLLVENNGCLYTCCDPHMTQAIEILVFESIARNSQQLTRERLMQLLPRWKGRSQADGAAGPGEPDEPGCFTLENTYERAAIVQEIYDSSI